MDQFTIKRIDIGARPDLAERFWCAGQSGHLPFLVPATEYPTDEEALDCNEFMLVGGLLYAWNEAPANTPDIDETVRMEQLGRLREGFGFVDVEGLISGYAHRIRILHGNAASYRMLRNGRTLFPDSSPIAADLALDLGYILAESALPECEPQVRELLDAADSVVEAETEAEIWQHLLVVRLAALKLIGTDDEVKDHLDNAVKDKITAPDLQVAVNRLSNMTSRDAGEAFQPKEWTGLTFQTMEEHECDH